MDIEHRIRPITETIRNSISMFWWNVDLMYHYFHFVLKFMNVNQKSELEKNINITIIVCNLQDFKLQKMQFWRAFCWQNNVIYKNINK